MKANTVCYYCISKHMIKRALKNLMHVYINRARLTAWEMGVFSKKISHRYTYLLH